MKVAIAVNDFLVLSATINDIEEEIRVPLDVVQAVLSGVYSPGEEIQEGEGFKLINLKLEEHPSEGLFVESVVIGTPQGRFQIWESFWDTDERVTKYPFEQL